MAGVKGFFRGMLARVLYSMPATAICWSTYEFFKFYLAGSNHSTYKSSITGKNALQRRDDVVEPAEKTAYVLPVTTADAVEELPTSPSATTATAPSSVSSGGATAGPAPSSATAIKSVCELPSNVTTSALNLHTRHTDVKSTRPFERGYSSP